MGGGRNSTPDHQLRNSTPADAIMFGAIEQKDGKNTT